MAGAGLTSMDGITEWTTGWWTVGQYAGLSRCWAIVIVRACQAISSFLVLHDKSFTCEAHVEHGATINLSCLCAGKR